MNHHKHDQANKTRFSFVILGLLVLGHITVLGLALRYLLPDVWAQELATGPWAILAVFVVCHLGNGFFEFFFHRYVLHAIMFSWLAPFARKHRHHHGLTPVKLMNPNKEPGLHPLRVQYAIETDEQEESSAFPPYALLAFMAIFSVPIVLLKILMPTLPILIGGYGAVIFSYTLYEAWHAVEHFPFATFWRPKVDHERLGKLWGKVYGFHQMHHGSVECNEAISGFFTLPLDGLFGTLKLPTKPFVDGQLASDEDLTPPKPCWAIRQLDSLATRRERAYQQQVGRKKVREHKIHRWIIDHQTLTFRQMAERSVPELHVKLSPFRLKRHWKALQRQGRIPAKQAI